MNRFFATSVVLGGLALATTSLARETTRVLEFTGVARDDSGAVVYREQHRLAYRGERHVSGETRYLSPEGEVIARMDSDYREHPYVPTYRFVDLRFQRQDGAEVEGDRVTVYGRGAADEALQRETLALRDDMVGGQGLHHFIRDHLDRLNAGEELRVGFLVPLAGEVYNFRIRQTGVSTSGDTAIFRIDIDNWFLRLFAPYLEVEYDLKNAHLLRYSGPSNLLRPDREAQTVTIEYRYPETVALNRQIPSQ
jgi:hypothetical protein